MNLGDVMKHGSLFGGIGGFDLAATWMGWENVFQCEKDIFCQRILRFYWPKARMYENIKEFDVVETCGSATLISSNVVRILKEKLIKRNLAAHPSTVVVL